MSSSFSATLESLTSDEAIDRRRAAAEVARIQRDSLHLMLQKAEDYMRMHHLGEAVAVVERELAAANKK